MCGKRISMYPMVIAIMHKALDKWSMVGIRIIHNTKEGEMSKHMDQVQDKSKEYVHRV